MSKWETVGLIAHTILRLCKHLQNFYLQKSPYSITVDMGRYAGLNVSGFNPIEVFTEILLHCLGQKCLF